MFALETTPATLTSVTPRTEVHGEDRVFAIRLGLKITGPNTLLDKLTPALRHMIYTAKPDAEPELPGVEQSTPLLRCPGVELLTIKGSFEGWTLAIDAHVDEDDPIKIGGCRVDKFRVNPSQGGTIDLMFRIGSNDVDQEEAGWLCSHLQQEITVTLTPPEKPAAAIDGTKEAFKKDHPDAGDLFAAQHGGGPEDEEGSEGGDPDAGQASKDALDAVGSPFGTREEQLQAEAEAGAQKGRRGRKAAAVLQ